MELWKELETLMEEKKWEEAYTQLKECRKKNPVSLQLLYNMYGLAGLLEKDIQEIKHYSKRYAALLTMISLTEEVQAYIDKYIKLSSAIISSGDGTSEDTAFKVISVNDEYQILNNVFKVEGLKQQSLVNKCDLMEFESSPYYEGTQIYFDISCSLDYMEDLFK